MYAVEKRNVAEKNTPYCDVCFRAGLSKREYTSHFVKSVPGPRGMVVCPTILNSVCSACSGRGHWANSKFCPMIRDEKKSFDRLERRERFKSNESNTSAITKKNTNLFSVLDEDDAVHAVVPVVSTGPSWADMAKKPAAIIPVVAPAFPANMSLLVSSKPVYKSSGFSEEGKQEALKILGERREAGCFDREKRTSWLDLSDDEEEDDVFTTDAGDDEDW